ncbi:TAXI family TRAP transporter solute-binding subunit [Candidatus Poribacteria bacterium]|nr:TAXI family TRAP transporter solute-binding subunit [Candidatus Poribacteria bacterium]
MTLWKFSQIILCPVSLVFWIYYKFLWRYDLKKNTFLSFITIIILFLSFAGCGKNEKTFFSIATGSTGGTYYPVGGALAQILNQHVPETSAAAQTGNASVANCNLIRTHEIESALAQNNVAYWAYTGTEIFSDEAPAKNVNAIASLYPETIQIVAKKSSGIKSVYDLKDKRVVVGAPGSGTEIDARKILAAHGLTYDDIKEDFLDFSGASQRLKDNQADAAFQTAGFPTSSIIDLSATADIVLVPIDENVMQELIDENKYYTKAIVPAGTYAGVDQDTPTLNLMAMWIVDADQPSQLIYKFTEALWEHRDQLEKVHDKCKEITLETALDGLGIPIHPGAEKYYKEVSHPKLGSL